MEDNADFGISQIKKRISDDICNNVHLSNNALEILVLSASFLNPFLIAILEFCN
jgi:hypothetical protein